MSEKTLEELEAELAEVEGKIAAAPHWGAHLAVLGASQRGLKSAIVHKRKLLLEHHNQVAGALVAQIVNGPAALGGDMVDSLIILESVVVGVFLVNVKLGGDEIVLEEFFKRVSERLAEKRLGGIEMGAKQ